MYLALTFNFSRLSLGIPSLDLHLPYLILDRSCPATLDPPPCPTADLDCRLDMLAALESRLPEVNFPFLVLHDPKGKRLRLIRSSPVCAEEIMK